MRARMLLLPAMLVAAGCSADAGPVRLLVGKWGGQEIGVTAEPQRVRIAFPCARATFTSAIAPDAAGDFTLRNGTVVAMTATSPPITIRGHIDGDQMTLVVVPTTSNVAEQTFVAIRDAPDPVSYCLFADRTAP